ncbi:succinyl-diaminopimelate desuccinylase [Antarcticirhabdus aurantiaca]|uniref:Succinyl-diaminopimelate desuccinylase n=1 Tax=Antarcticirhabdus aurantiaca TaxID=2606717 RepID=A0ACD4NJU4_9HYPH|nr:succinyl-diaminopimelate desuccinylase [Antarcticirhabdus aurantiaca]WAJ27001.1 succinyl-diaminopimelate desuccinylase [Jeongeuplla avenae]
MTIPDPTNPSALLSALIRCPSVTPEEGGALAALEAMLRPLGFAVERPVFSEPDTPNVENLFARRGETGPHLVFAGHTDVVPPGAAEDWREGPFSGAIRDGFVWGRGAVDMKGGIACFLAALGRMAAAGELPATGRISLLITGDEEGPAINGTVKLLDWARNRGERFDACIVGEPTNPAALGDMIKIGRRGSLSGHVHVDGVQGHAAYPHLAANPIPLLLALGQSLIDPPLDAGNARFDPSNLEIVSVDTGNPSLNVIPARARLSFNVRFNDEWSGTTLKAEIERRLTAAAGAMPMREGAQAPHWRVEWKAPVSDVFLTTDDALARTLSEAVEAVTGRRPALSTSGGTSDARFIKNHCPVAEFGLVGQTMHKVDERASVADLEQLTEIYRRFVSGWFAARG